MINPDVGEVREYDTSMMQDKDMCGRIVYVVLEKFAEEARVLFLTVENEGEVAVAGKIARFRYDQPLFLFSDIVALGPDVGA